MFAVLSSLVLLLSSTNVLRLVDASSVSAAADVSGAAAGVLTSSHRQRRHLRAAAAANHKRAGRGLDDATEALEAAEEAEEEEAAPVDEATEMGWTDLELTQLNEEDEEGRDTIPEAPVEEERDTIPEVPADEDLTPEEEAAAAELTGEGKSTGDDIAEVVAEEEAAPAEDETEDEAPADTTEEEESPAMGSTEETSEEPTDEDEDTAAATTEEEAPMDEEILDELVNEEDELPEDVVQELNGEIEDMLDAVAAVTSGEPTGMGDDLDALDEDTEQQWAPVGAPTVEDPEPVPAPTVDYGNDAEEGPAPTVDYFDFKYTPEPTRPYSPPDEEYDPLDGIDAEVEESGSYGSTNKEPVESPFEDGSWQDEAYKKGYDWLNGADGEEDMAEVARDQRVKVAVGVLLGLGITLALITASCALNNPDGLCAGCCRLILTLFHCIGHVLCLPCRVCCGCGSKREDARQGATLVGRSDLEFS